MISTENVLSPTQRGRNAMRVMAMRAAGLLALLIVAGVVGWGVANGQRASAPPPAVKTAAPAPNPVRTPPLAPVRDVAPTPAPAPLGPVAAAPSPTPAPAPPAQVAASAPQPASAPASAPPPAPVIAAAPPPCPGNPNALGL